MARKYEAWSREEFTWAREHWVRRVVFREGHSGAVIVSMAPRWKRALFRLGLMRRPDTEYTPDTGSGLPFTHRPAPDSEEG